MMDIATGLSIEPPAAWSIRAPIRTSMLGAMLHTSEPSVKRTSPSWKIRTRPKRSAVEPDTINKDASTKL